PNAQSLAILAVGMGDLAQAAAGRQREPPPHLRQCRLTLGSLRPLHQRTERLADFPERLSVAAEDLLPDLPDRLVPLLSFLVGHTSPWSQHPVQANWSTAAPTGRMNGS